MLIRCLFLLLLVGCAAPLTVSNRDFPAPDDPAERFAALAFRNEAGDGKTLLRWEEPVAIYSQGPYFRYIDRAVLQVSEATGHPMEHVRSPSQANVAVFVAPWPEIRGYLSHLPAGRFSDPRRRFTCAAFLYGRTSLLRVLVFIDADLEPDHIRRCAVQEMGHTMGIYNDIDDRDGTVFSSRSTRDTLSDSDKLMLRTLYDPRLRPGMDRDEAMPIVRQIMR